MRTSMLKNTYLVYRKYYDTKKKCFALLCRFRENSDQNIVILLTYMTIYPSSPSCYQHKVGVATKNRI